MFHCAVATACITEVQIVTCSLLSLCKHSSHENCVYHLFITFRILGARQSRGILRTLFNDEGTPVPHGGPSQGQASPPVVQEEMPPPQAIPGVQAERYLVKSALICAS